MRTLLKNTVEFTFYVVAFTGFFILYELFGGWFSNTPEVKVDTFN